MITTLRYYCAGGSDPYENLAIEEHLLNTTTPGIATLYLWQNQNTVVIGRNQNPWAECRTQLLEDEGGKLARRLSGGGAVFHDLGNLNFTFLVPEEDYDLDKQLRVIETACKMAGIQVERSGRNDVLAQGRKFSGNAFYHTKNTAYHHGTLLIDTDGDKLQRYLSPPKAKLEAKGVRSVRSRVVNLTELSPTLTCEIMKEYMLSAFQEVYGLLPQPVSFLDPDWGQIRQLQKRNGDWEFLYGTPLKCDVSFEGHFPWGHIQLQLQVQNGIVREVRVYSDAMDYRLPETVSSALTGCRFTLEDLKNALPQQVAQDLGGLLEEQLK